MRRILRITLRGALTVAIVYLLLVAGFYGVMCQTPGFFTHFMAKTPGIVFSVVPFKPLWMSARAGRLKVGDQAPDFSLERNDRTSIVTLSSLKGKAPVVLIFGSYT